uniref:Anoctamin dimerisation domain-containing protein n=1 Tax=Sinocyclocheilus anshuiensis TaxID=1608454 RepID=A0A671LP10_9TELE
MVHHSGSIQSFKQQKGMHTSISEILKEKTLKSSRRSLPCLAQSQTHPQNLNHFLSVPLSPEPKTYTHNISASCTNITPPPTGTSVVKCYLKCISHFVLQHKLHSYLKKNPSGLMFRDGKKRIDYILVYKKSSPQVEKRCTFERNLRAEGLMLEKEVQNNDSGILTVICLD